MLIVRGFAFHCLITLIKPKNFFFHQKSLIINIMIFQKIAHFNILRKVIIHKKYQMKKTKLHLVIRQR